MRLLIKDLEKKLGKKIKTNYFSVGVDTATHTGIGFIKTTSTEIDINWSLIHFEANSIQQLYKQMYEEFGNYIDKSVHICVVEDVYLGMNPDVTIKLARFGALAMVQAINNNVHFVTINARSARAKLFKLDTKKYKGKTKVAVKDYLTSIGIDINEDNCADGVILALLGIIEGMDFRSNVDIAKDKKKLKTKAKIKKSVRKRK